MVSASNLGGGNCIDGKRDKRDDLCRPHRRKVDADLLRPHQHPDQEQIRFPQDELEAAHEQEGPRNAQPTPGGSLQGGRAGGEYAPDAPLRQKEQEQKDAARPAQHRFRRHRAGGPDQPPVPPPIASGRST
jgi:hypothetical protein